MQQTVWKRPLMDSRSLASNVACPLLLLLLLLLASSAYRLPASFACRHQIFASLLHDGASARATVHK